MNKLGQLQRSNLAQPALAGEEHGPRPLRSHAARRTLLSYGGAIFFTALAVLVRFLLDPALGDHLPLATLFGAVALATWLGGYGPALLSVIVGYLACDYLFIDPRGQLLPVGTRDVAGLILYLTSCAIIIGFGESTRVARRHLEAQKAGLEQAVGKQRGAEEELRQQQQHSENLIVGLKQSEQRFARFMHHLPGLAWIKDLQGRYVYANDSAMRVFRGTRDDLYGRTDEQVFPGETAERFKTNDRAAIASEAGVQVIETLEHDDGIVHHSVVSKFPITGSDGRPAFIGGMAIDITDHRRAEKVLAESEERFRQLAENINEVFWMTDPQTTQLLYISPAYERVWGRTCQSLYDNPRSFMEAVHPDDQEHVRVDVLERQSLGQQVDKEYRVVRPDGSIRWVRDRAFPVRNAAGQFYRLVGIIDDFTEKKEAEESLRDANRRKDDFLATLAHELRNPLAPIRNAAEVLRMKDLADPQLKSARDMIDRQVGQMVRLIDDLLDISRITRGKLNLRKERAELSAVLQSAVEASRPLIDSQSHDLTVSVAPEPVHLDGDPIRLAQVFSNLLNNAAKYTEKGGHIWLTTERQGSQVVVSVRDTGIGIAADHLPRVFEMFAQVNPVLERSKGGLGIGLALVRGLIELHSGTVGVRSAGPGKGSEFTVRLPILQAQAPDCQPPSVESEESCAKPKCRILVADDLRDSADSLAMMLRLAGHVAQTAYDGLEAVQAAATFRPDVVLMDIGMPRMNGYEAARHVREQPWGEHMVLVALTGWGQQEDRRRAAEAGFDYHIVKPIGPKALEEVLQSAKRGRPTRQGERNVQHE